MLEYKDGKWTLSEEYEHNRPKNPLKEKWDKLYPPIPMAQYSQVCDGYSCMWCGRCPLGDNWKCPEEDKEVYEEYLKELHAYHVNIGLLPY